MPSSPHAQPKCARAADSDLDMGADFISHALKQGHFCVGAFYEERLVSYVWRAFGDTKITHRFTLKFGKPNRYGYKALTLPEHRGLHLLNTIALYSDKLCFDLGYTYAIGFIETHNFASIRSDARHGNKHVGWILWMDRKPFVFCYTSKGARAIGVTLSRSD